MQAASDTSPATPPCQCEAPRSGPQEEDRVQSVPMCIHCGGACGEHPVSRDGKFFCCEGCVAVYDLMTENGMGRRYQAGQAVGARSNDPALVSRYQFLDHPEVRARLVDYEDQGLTRVTFNIPGIHCVSCVGVLENLYRLNPAISQARVNFPRRELTLAFDPACMTLSEAAILLASMGYEPDLSLSDLSRKPSRNRARRLWLQLGLAGFAFGNIMLFSLPAYLGMDTFSGPMFRSVFAWLSLALALPVIVYSAADYWQAAWRCLVHRRLTIEVPIAIGLTALFGQSFYEISTGVGEGYCDSLTGLLFFLLCGRVFQRKTFDRLSFDRDYKSFFPLSATRKRPDAASPEEKVSLDQLQVGDRLLIRHGELVPADARLVSGVALIDYSFVTGESEPVEKAPGDHLYAGGRQTRGTIEVEMVKAVSQSHLTSLWNQDVFQKESGPTLDTLTNRFSRYFTLVVILIALGAALYWWRVEPDRAFLAFTAVLIVACPCALALAAPFTLGTAQRLLGRNQVYLKNTEVLESLAVVRDVVFDKTGTLTSAVSRRVQFHGPVLDEAEKDRLFTLASQSTHPYSQWISQELSTGKPLVTADHFEEIPGCGIRGQVEGQDILMGSASWLASLNVAVPEDARQAGSGVHVALDGQYRGQFRIGSLVRPETGTMIRELSSRHDLALLSGDHEQDQALFQDIFEPGASLNFEQGPLDKLAFIRQRQQESRRVLMVGDGLNDAGALKQADVGIAVVEDIGAFTPASDIIMTSGMVPRLGGLLRYARASMSIVKLSFLISILYNVVGIQLAARGLLSPVICAILMPVSSITVVGLATGLTSWVGRRILHEGGPARSGRTPSAKVGVGVGDGPVMATGRSA